MKEAILFWFLIFSFAIEGKIGSVVEGRSNIGGMSLFYGLNSTIKINSLEVNIDESFDVGDIWKNSLFWMNKVRIMSSNNIKEVFKVNEGKVSLIKVEIYSSSGMISEIVGDYGHMKELVLGECNINNLMINGEKSLIKSDYFEIRECLFRNISSMENEKKLLQNTASSYERCELFGNKFDGCNNVFYNGILSSGIYLKFKSMNNSYLNIRDDSEGNDGIFSSDCLFVKDIFKNNSNNNNGGVLYLINSSLEIQNCEFEKCSSEKEGGSVFLNGFSFLSLNSNYSDCLSKGRGGCLYIDCSYSYFVDGCITGGRGGIRREIKRRGDNNNNNNNNEEEEEEEEEEEGRGGGIYIKENSGICNIKNFLFGECKAKYGGGIYISKDIKGLKLYNCYFIFCNGIEKGGGIYIDNNNNNNNNITIDECIFEKNNGSEGKDIFISYSLEEDKVRRMIKNYKSDSEEGINCFGMICLNRKDEEILKDSFEPEMELEDFRKGLKKIKKDGYKDIESFISILALVVVIIVLVVGFIIVIVCNCRNSASVKKAKIFYNELYQNFFDEYYKFYEKDIEPTANLSEEEKFKFKHNQLSSKYLSLLIENIPKSTMDDKPVRRHVGKSRRMTYLENKYIDDIHKESLRYMEEEKLAQRVHDNSGTVLAKHQRILRELKDNHREACIEVEEREGPERERLEDEYTEKYERELAEWKENFQANKERRNAQIEEIINSVEYKLEVIECNRPKTKEYDDRFNNLSLEQKKLELEYYTNLSKSKNKNVPFPNSLPPRVDFPDNEDWNELKDEFVDELNRGMLFKQIEEVLKIYIDILKKRLSK